MAVIAALEGFFLFAYNFEAFGGRFHNNFWFAASWGSLPVLTGYVMQENAVSILALAVAGAAGLVSYAEIRLSRPYKDLKRAGGDKVRAKNLENGLKAVSLATIAFALAMLAYRVIFS